MKKFKKIIIILIISITLIAGAFILDYMFCTNYRNCVFTKMTRTFTYSKKDWENYEKNVKIYNENIKAYEESKKNYSPPKLIVATEKPSDIEAQLAIIRHSQGEIIKLLAENDAQIRIGKCYEADLQKVEEGNPEVARVTAMVCAFNSNNEYLGNIEYPLYPKYDFVKFSGDSDWYITDYSQSIPYDYELNK